MIVAAIDIGSNSVRLLVRDDRGRALRRDATVTGLARGVDAGRRLSDEAVRATLSVIERYRAELSALGDVRVHAVATSAARDAANGAEVMAAIGDVLGSHPEIISGDREAALAFAGASDGLGGTGPRVVVDIGGGSTEVIRGDDGVDWARSYDIGSVRLTDRALPGRPPSSRELVAAHREVDRVLSLPPVDARAERIIGVAGTFTSLAAMHLGLERYDPDLVHDSTMTRADVEAMVDRLAVLDVEETARIPSLEPARAPVILSGAVVAARVMAAIGADEVLVRESDLLDGLAAELVG